MSIKVFNAIKLNDRFLNILWLLVIFFLSIPNAFAYFRPVIWEYKSYRTTPDATIDKWAASPQEASELWCKWAIVAWANNRRYEDLIDCQIPTPSKYILTWRSRIDGHTFPDQDGLFIQRQAVCPSNSYRSSDRQWCFCNPTFHEKRAADGSTQCTQYTVSIAGPGSTMALPSLAGPIAQEVSIIDSDGPVQDMPVSIEFINLKNNVKSTMSGKTMAGGKFSFIYTPPYFNEAQIALNATCEKCQNVASKTISVIPAEAEPQMCRR